MLPPQSKPGTYVTAWASTCRITGASSGAARSAAAITRPITANIAAHIASPRGDETTIVSGDHTTISEQERQEPQVVRNPSSEHRHQSSAQDAPPTEGHEQLPKPLGNEASDCTRGASAVNQEK